MPVLGHAARDGRPIADERPAQFRKELQLAKAETGEKIEQVSGARRSVLIGAILAAIVSTLAVLLVDMGIGEPLATAISGSTSRP